MQCFNSNQKKMPIQQLQNHNHEFLFKNDPVPYPNQAISGFAFIRPDHPDQYINWRSLDPWIKPIMFI